MILGSLLSTALPKLTLSPRKIDKETSYLPQEWDDRSKQGNKTNRMIKSGLVDSQTLGAWSRLHSISATHPQCPVFKYCILDVNLLFFFSSSTPSLLFICIFFFSLSICYRKMSVGVSVIQDQTETSRAPLCQCSSEVFHIWMQHGSGINCSSPSSFCAPAIENRKHQLAISSQMC